MSRETQLAKNTLIISFGTFLPKIISVITLPIITARLTKTEYGQYDLIATLVFLVLPIATLQIQSAAFRFLIEFREDKEKTKNIITSMLFFAGVASIAAILILFSLLNQTSIWMRLLIGLYFLLDMLLAILQQIVRGLSLNKVYSVSTTINSSVNLIGILVMVQGLDTGLTGVLLSLVIAAFIGICYLICRIELWVYIDKQYFSFQVLKELLSYSWPMIPNNLSNWVLKLSDRLVITAVLGVEANAVYAVANKIPNLFVTVQSTFVYAWQENASLAVNDADVDAYYSNIFSSIFKMLVGIMALVIAVTPIMFTLLIRGDYADAYYQMPLLFMAMMFSCTSSVLGGIYIAHKKTRSVGITTIVAAACNLLIDLLCVHSLGITAGSVSTLISYIVLTIYRMWDVQKIQKIKYDYKSIIFWLVILCLMCIANWIDKLWLNVVNVGVGIIVAYISNGELFNKFFKKIIENYIGKKRI